MGEKTSENGGAGVSDAVIAGWLRALAAPSVEKEVARRADLLFRDPAFLARLNDLQRSSVRELVREAAHDASLEFLGESTEAHDRMRLLAESWAHGTCAAWKADAVEGCERITREAMARLREECLPLTVRAWRWLVSKFRGVVE